jgi:tRNA-specific 2-thiouridylase
MKANRDTTVFVGLSGGVDSSVSASLLKAAGYNVVGVFIRTWQPDFIECSFREDRLDAMRVAAYLDIPFLECDAEEAYKRAVADYMIAEYKSGRTPNPDVMCNREIKFGVFWDFAKSRGADYIATGHYAIAEDCVLKKANDPAKDQAYFLYRLTSNDLAHVMFPIGHLKKTEVRKLAEKRGLPNATKKDSQGICMLGDLDLKKFLEHYIPTNRGDVLDEAGEIIGYHDGALFLTLGERHGFTVTKKTPNDERYYIVAKDITHNTVTVAHRSLYHVASEARDIFILDRATWVGPAPKPRKFYTAQVRYHGEYLPCTVEIISNQKASIVFETPQLAASGQSIVIYDGDVCLGGGIVE